MKWRRGLSEVVLKTRAQFSQLSKDFWTPANTLKNVIGRSHETVRQTFPKSLSWTPIGKLSGKNPVTIKHWRKFQPSMAGSWISSIS
ncbi:hypothetical protein CEXT_165521 [Caerostris extrusa]|uniref:Transposase n=1 Tax=Caerostris extrusa TaxID=172846 RepID=A0AAV4XX60_CAEEX|nr:hypothetical protein CEXT_165521 [Caerostris extrusa]